MPDNRHKKKIRAKGSTKFAKGKSGNPGGRPKKILAIREWCQARGEKMLKIAMDIAEDKEARDGDRLTAIKLLIGYGFGQAPQKVELGEEDSKVIALTLGIKNL